MIKNKSFLSTNDDKCWKWKVTKKSLEKIELSLGHWGQTHPTMWITAPAAKYKYGETMILQKQT